MDQANALGLTALVNLPVEAERDGMNYDDTAAVRRQHNQVLEIVRNTKDHPAVPAYASEFYKLTDQERLMVVKIAVQHAAGKLQIVAQSNHPSLRVAIQLAKANIDVCAEVIMLRRNC